jgi:hypothetical protein
VIEVSLAIDEARMEGLGPALRCRADHRNPVHELTGGIYDDQPSVPEIHQERRISGHWEDSVRAFVFLGSFAVTTEGVGGARLQVHPQEHLLEGVCTEY